MFLVPFFDLQNFILLVRTVPFLKKIIFISSYTAKNNYFLLYQLIQDLPYILFNQSKVYIKAMVVCFFGQVKFSSEKYIMAIYLSLYASINFYYFHNPA